MDIENSVLQLPSFTLYPIATQDLKTCYQSKHTKIFCAINGPYYDRKIHQLRPYFNISITNAQESIKGSFNPSQLIKLQKKVQEVLSIMLVKGNYERMVFDINIEIIETNELNPTSFILSPIINLVSYSCMIKSLELESAFSCSAGVLRNGKICWEYESEEEKKEDDKVMIICSDHRDKKILMSIFEGEYTYVHFERLSSGLLQANDELNRYQIQKLIENYDIFHQ